MTISIVESNKDLLEHQYGLRGAHSTVDAISTMLNLAKGPLNSACCYALLALRVKNVFKFAN